MAPITSAARRSHIGRRPASNTPTLIEGMDRETYVGDARTQAAVERKFGIIGEALNRLHRTHLEIADRIPPLREVVGFRNLLLHGYATVIPERVWDYTPTSRALIEVYDHYRDRSPALGLALRHRL